MKLKFAVIIQHERQGFSYMKGKDFHNKLQWKTFTFPPNQSKTSDGSARSKEKIPLPLTSFIGEVTASAAFSLAFNKKSPRIPRTASVLDGGRGSRVTRIDSYLGRFNIWWERGGKRNPTDFQSWELELLLSPICFFLKCQQSHWFVIPFLQQESLFLCFHIDRLNWRPTMVMSYGSAFT